MIPHGSDDTPCWLVRARREIGVVEGVNDTRILQYRTATKLRPWAKTSGPGSPWCADFAGWCLEGEGITSTRSAAAASYKTWGKPSELRAGAVVVFGPHDPDAGGTGHVGFVDTFPVDGWLWVISGNCGNAVRRKRYRVADIVACRWPEIP